MFDLDLQNYGCKDIFLCNLNVKGTKNFIEVKDPFLKEILEIRAEANFEHKITTEEHFREQVLWYNSLIRINNKPIFFKDWYTKGITKIRHSQTSHNNKYWTLSDFSTKHGIKTLPLSFHGLISAIKSLHKSVSNSTEDGTHIYEPLCVRLLKSKRKFFDL